MPTSSDAVASDFKKDQGKAPWHLFPFDAAEKIVEILAFGAKKYSENGWQSGIHSNQNRTFSALIRHLTAWRRGEKLDPESGLSHLAHAGCNILFLIWAEINPRPKAD